MIGKLEKHNKTRKQKLEAVEAIVKQERELPTQGKQQLTKDWGKYESTLKWLKILNRW